MKSSESRYSGGTPRLDPGDGRAREGIPGFAHARSGAPRTRRDELIGSALSVLMATLFAVVVILGKKVQAGHSPFVMLALRFGGQSVLLVSLLAITRRPLLPARGERLALALAGTLGYGSETAFYFSALNHGSAAAVTLLFYTYPVWVMLITMGLDRRSPQALLFAALALAIVGSALVVLGGGAAQIETIGIVLALCTSFAYTAYLVGTDRRVRRTDPLTAAAWLGVGACFANVVYSLAFGIVVPAIENAWRIAGMAIFSAGAFASMLAGLRLLGAVRNAIIGIMEPLTLAVLAYFFLGEPITAPVLLGGTLILAGAVLAMLIRTTTTVEPGL